jgi:hypothetical protein
MFGIDALIPAKESIDVFAGHGCGSFLSDNDEFATVRYWQASRCDL